MANNSTDLILNPEIGFHADEHDQSAKPVSPTPRKKQMTLKMRVTLPPLVVMFFFLVVSVFAYQNFTKLGDIVKTVIGKSQQSVAEQTNLAYLITNVQKDVSQFFFRQNEEDFDLANASLASLRTEINQKNNKGAKAAITRLEELVAAVKVRFDNLKNQEKSLNTTQTEIFNYFEGLPPERIKKSWIPLPGLTQISVPQTPKTLMTLKANWQV